MAARPTWKGFLKISLVNIPVRVFPATDSAATISFNQLHAECQTRIQQKRWCPHCEREVPMSEIAKGYEFEKGRYVVMSEEDISKVRPESTRVIDLVQFTDAAAIDPIYIERPVLSGAGWSHGAGCVCGHARGDEREGRHRQARPVWPRVSRRRPAEGPGAGDVHDAPLEGSAQHGQHQQLDGMPSKVKPDEIKLAKQVIENFEGETRSQGDQRHLPGRAAADHRREDCRRGSGRDRGGDAAEGGEPHGRAASEPR